MESLTDEQVMEDCTNVLKRMLKKDIPYPIRIIRCVAILHALDCCATCYNGRDVFFS